MFNITKILQDYFTRELLPDYLNNTVALNFNHKLVAAMFGSKLFRGSVIDSQWCPCGPI